MLNPKQMTKLFALNESEQRRLERLARDAGRSPVGMLKFVLRDGFEFCEWEVRESRAADEGTRRRGAVPNHEARRQAQRVIDAAHARRRTRKAA